MQPPYNYDTINAAAAPLSQSFLHVHNTQLAGFFRKLLFEDLFSKFNIKVPEWWDLDYLRYTLFGAGFVAIINTNLFGVIPQQANLTGYNVFYRPTQACIANPLIRPVILNIGTDCEIIKMRPDYTGIGDVISYYGDLMALCYEAVSVNVLNSRLAYVVGVSHKAAADTFKAVYDDVASGKPAVVYRDSKAKAGALTDQTWQTFTQNLQQNFIAPDVLDTLNGLHDDFYRIIGIPTLSSRKKERVNLDESQKMDDATQCKSALWLDEMQEGVKRAVKMFPVLDGKFSITANFTGEEVTNDAGETEPDGAVSL